MIKEIEEAIAKGKIAVIEENERTGEVSVKAVDNDRDLALEYFGWADTPEKFASAPNVLFIKELYKPTPIMQI